MIRSVAQQLQFGGATLAVAAAFLHPPVQAQDASPPLEEADELIAENGREETIVVTGSLIQRPNNTAVSPIVTVDEAALRETGTSTLQDALNQIPSFTVGGNSSTGGQGGGGRSSLNLHGLGTNRNLVLLDGRRLPVSDISGNVDINILPEAIIGGVDVITGGASAIYGSDAMSGVVNFRTVNRIDGIRADALSSISERGDAFRFNGSLAFGTDFAENRGNMIAAFSYVKQDAVDGSSRSFFDDKTPSSFIGTGTYVPNAGNAPSAAVIQALFAGYGAPGARNPLANLGFNDDRTLFVQNGAVNYRGPTDSNGYLVIANNVRMPVGPQIQFQNALERKTAFVKGDYEVTDSLTAYGQFMFVDLTVQTESGGSLTQFPALTTIPVTNPFIPADLRTVLASRPNAAAPFLWNGRYVGIPYKGWDEDYTVQQYLVGLRGDLSSDWRFDVFAAYDQSVHNQTMHNAVLKTQVQRLLNAADGGATLCAGGFNPFGDANARSLSDACINFMTEDAKSTETLTQSQVQAQLNGKLFDLPAGAVQIALVGSYRKNTYEWEPDSDLVAPNAFNLIAPGNPGANIESVVNTLPVPKTSIEVKELAAQIDVPLLTDRPWARELGIGAAARVSDYSVTGSVVSYEADARWRPLDDLLIRGSYQRAVRAPNIGELFSPPQGSQLVIGTPPGGLGDPCDVRATPRTGANGAQVAALCVAQGVPAAAIGSYQFPTTAAGQVTAGSTALTPEKADTFNIGMVWKAPRNEGILGDVSVSLDYFNISINDVISIVPGLTVLSQCFNLDGSNPTYSVSNASCAAISRDPTSGQILNVATPFANLGNVQTDGIEAQIHWGLPAPFLGETGRIAVDTAISWLNSYDVQLLANAPVAQYVGISVGGAQPNALPPRATPEWRALTTLAYRSDVVGMGLRWRFQSKLDDVSTVLTPTNAQVGVSSYSLFDLFANYTLQEGIDVRGGINNLFDKDLPFVASSQNGTDVALYDAIGRSFYVGVRFGF